jgi:hypothetical protein
MKLLRMSYIISTIISAWKQTSPFIVTLATIWMYARVHGSLTSSIIFPLIEVLPMISDCLQHLPRVTLDYYSAKLNAARIDEFLNKPERKEIITSSLSGSVSFKDVSIAWPTDELKGEDFEKRYVIHHSK